MEICVNCKQEKEDVKLQINPYEKDVNDTIVFELLCEDCMDSLYAQSIISGNENR